jgi:hypothetical protein
VGYRDVAEVRNAARAFYSWDALYGGGVVREAVVAQLRYGAVKLFGVERDEGVAGCRRGLDRGGIS